MKLSHVDLDIGNYGDVLRGTPKEGSICSKISIGLRSTRLMYTSRDIHSLGFHAGFGSRDSGQINHDEIPGNSWERGVFNIMYNLDLSLQ